MILYQLKLISWTLQIFSKYFYVQLFKFKYNFFFFISNNFFYLTNWYTSLIKYRFLKNQKFLYLQWSIISLFMWLNLKLHFRHKTMWIKISKRRKRRSIRAKVNWFYRVFIRLKYFYLYRKKRLLTFNNVILIGTNKYLLDFISEFIVSIKRYNVYTLRGIKLARHTFLKRVGKISQYTQFKSKIF